MKPKPTHIRDAMANINVTFKVVGIRTWLIRFKVATWIIKLGCRIGRFGYEQADQEYEIDWGAVKCGQTVVFDGEPEKTSMLDTNGVCLHHFQIGPTITPKQQRIQQYQSEQIQEALGEIEKRMKDWPVEIGPDTVFPSTPIRAVRQELTPIRAFLEAQNDG